jgi:hypothetical protein
LQLPLCEWVKNGEHKLVAREFSFETAVNLEKIAVFHSSAVFHVLECLTIYVYFTHINHPAVLAKYFLCFL